ncbi:uncharacterized protein F5Z01DRAFT_419265 [Emericellopsis atlantica]|uniref:Rhodopsin domain-containing protein n=1 Tax=Emericellopsis atlantica TaxID=2614577 RepID=A0A9P7ZEL4_9HYPO|nr:uncharacterized protein F5Z01DRAFT_419265 [Emericellopsis atlantica]KAG9250217.1 hypothetical protein F5Z01DRAFT_419265 [Emericellopsis atlantica]
MTVIFPVVQPDQKAVLGVAISFAIPPVLAVCARLAARHVANRKLDTNDYLIMVAMVMAVALEAVSITGVIQCGIGYGHTLDIIAEFGPEPVINLSKLRTDPSLLIPLQILWALSLSVSKVSILLLYIRVFPVTSLMWCACGAIVLIAVWAVGTVIAGLTICQPFAFNWDKTIPGGSCGDQVLSFTITGIVNLITDVMVLALPLPYLVRLQLPTYKKMVLIGVFSIGFLTCVVSGFRIHTLSSMDFADITYSIPLANIFSGLEPSIAVILACVPLLRPLLGRAGKYSANGTARFTDDSAAGSSNAARAPSGAIKKADGFQPLSDDSSQYRLRPMGPKSHTAVTTDREVGRADSSDNSDHGGYAADSGIRVKQEWNVSGGHASR